MTDLQIIKKRTESAIDTNINELRKMLNETKLNIQLSAIQKVERIAIIQSHINIQAATRVNYSSMISSVKMKF